jgi:hypothetical protein
MRDIGTGGFDGFEWNTASVSREIYYHRGGHSGPLTPTCLTDIATHILTGQDPPAPYLVPSPPFSKPILRLIKREENILNLDETPDRRRGRTRNIK